MLTRSFRRMYGTVQKAQVERLSKKADQGILLDVRGADEHKSDRRIPGSVNVAVDDIERVFRKDKGEFKKSVGVELPSKGDKIVTHCEKGGRATKAAEALEKLGFTNVHVYQGSCEDWFGNSADDAKEKKHKKEVDQSAARAGEKRSHKMGEVYTGTENTRADHHRSATSQNDATLRAAQGDDRAAENSDNDDKTQSILRSASADRRDDAARAGKPDRRENTPGQQAASQASSKPRGGGGGTAPGDKRSENTEVPRGAGDTAATKPAGDGQAQTRFVAGATEAPEQAK